MVLLGSGTATIAGMKQECAATLNDNEGDGKFRDWRGSLRMGGMKPVQ